MTGGGEQFAGSSESGGLPVVLAVLAQIRDLATMVQGAPGWQLSDIDARLAVKEAAVAARQIESAYLGLVYELDQRPGVVKGARAGFQARTFIRHALNQTTAHAKDDVAAAYALRPDADPAKGGLPRLGAAFAAGEVSREHVNAAVRAASRIPKPLLSAPAADTSADDAPAGAEPSTVDESTDDRPGDSDSDSAGDPTVDPAGDSADQTAAEATDAPADEATDAPADEATDAPADEATDAPADEATDAPADEATDAPADEATDVAADEATADADETAAASSGDQAPSSGDADPATASGSDAGAGGWGLFRCGGDVVDEEFTRHARDYDPAATARLARELLAGLDPDGTSSFDPDACMKRNLRLIQDGEGMWILNGVLDPASGAFLKAMLDHLSKPRPARSETADDGTLVDVEDTRTAGQRNADALMDLVRQGQAGNLGTRGGEPPRITIITGAGDLAAARAADPSTHPAPSSSHTSDNTSDSRTKTAGPAEDSETSEPGPEEESRRWFTPWTAPPTRLRRDNPSGCAGGAGQGGKLATGERIDPLLLARLSCDSILQAVLLAPSGAILDQGREARTVTAAQRRALTVRDKGCTIPGCTAPAHWCEGHHVTFWRNDGPTDIANLALVCGRHHTEIHLGIWILTMRDGVPWVTPPEWLDPTQTPLRNSYFTDLGTTRRTGTQLRLNLDDERPTRDDPRPDDR